MSNKQEMEACKSALAGIVKAVDSMMEVEESRDHMEIELAAVGLQQAMETGKKALGGDKWDKWGDWVSVPLEKMDVPTTLKPDKVFVNSIYEAWVTVRHMFGDKKNPPIAELSIKRRDKLPIDHNHWRTIQRIKNELLGHDADAAMLYPCGTRLMDTANQYTIYAMPPGMLMPFGDTTRLVSSKSLAEDSEDPRKGARQRPYTKDERPAGDLAESEEMFEAAKSVITKALEEEKSND